MDFGQSFQLIIIYYLLYGSLKSLYFHPLIFKLFLSIRSALAFIKNEISLSCLIGYQEMLFLKRISKFLK